MREPLLAAVAASVSSLAAAQAGAGEAPASGPATEEVELEEVVVSGYRLLDTPLQSEAVAGTSLDEDIFRNAASTSRWDVLRTVPGVTVLNLGGKSTVVIRGTSTAPDGDPNGAAAASYIGDVALSGLSGSRENVDLSNYDIERIDVLRGPQGFAFGAGAVSGVVRTVPRPADPHSFGASVAGALRNVDHGQDPGYEVDGFLNMPLVQDVLGLRLTAYTNREENPIWSTRYDRQGSPSTLRGGRMSLRYVPADGLTVDARYLYEHSEPMDITRIATTIGEYSTNDPLEWSRRETHLAWLTANWDLGFATATYVGSQLRASTPAVYPNIWSTSVSEGAQIESRDSADTRNVTQELRLANADRRGFDWTVGAYYERRRMRSEGHYFVSGTDTPTSSEWDSDGVDDPELANVSGSAWNTFEKQKSGFGELTWWLNGQLGLTLGTRYLDRTATTGYAEHLEGLPEEVPTMIGTFPGSGKWWKKADVSWMPHERQLYYVRFGEVTRPGGTNYGALDASCPAEYAARVQEFYAGDRMRTLEAGAKVARADGRLSVNASTYYSRWKNAPTYTGALCDNGINYYIDNAALIELYGVELDAQLRFNHRLSASVSSAWGLAEIVEVGPSFTGGIPGDRMPGNPEWKVSASLDYRQPFLGTLELFGGAGFSYTGRYNNGLSSDWSTYAEFVTFPGLDVEPVGLLPGGATHYSDPGSGNYILFDARLGLSSGPWKLTLFADNLFGSKARTLVNYLYLTPEGESTITRVTPRTLGMRMEWMF